MDRIGLKTPPSGIGTTLEECLAITKDIGSCSSSARCSRSVALAEASSTTRLSLTSVGPASSRHTRSRCSRSPSQHVKPSPLFSLHYCCLSHFFAVLERLDFFRVLLARFLQVVCAIWRLILCLAALMDFLACLPSSRILFYTII
jgi:hypothetical protein